MRQPVLLLAVVALAAALAGASPSAAEPQSRQAVREHAALASALGAKLFLDPRLSPSGQVACATCHSPEHGFGPPNARAVQLAGEERVRVWRLYLRAARRGFETGFTSVYQVRAHKPA
jgi:cytochrome c peroxidase